MLDRFRAGLPEGKASLNLPASYMPVAPIIIGYPKAAIGVDVSPHLFRTAAVSTAASKRSDVPKLAAGVLGHVDDRIAELHYDRARPTDAAKSYAGIFDALRADRGRSGDCV